MDSNKEFVWQWTDELVKQFMRESWMESDTYIPLAIEAFKEKRTSKPKRLFVTVDKKEIFDGDAYYKIYEYDYTVREYHATAGGTYDQSYTKDTFGTKEAADSWILMNKPFLSVNDIFSFSEKLAQNHNYLTYHKEDLLKYAKQKLNK